MSPVLTLLYSASAVLLAASGFLVLRRSPRDPLNRDFAAACLFLLVWLASLFLLFHRSGPSTATALGRANFAAVAAAVYLGFRVVAHLVGYKPRLGRYTMAETLLLAAVTLATPLVDRAEILRAGEHVTAAGPLFAWFALHVACYPAAAVVLALRVRASASRRVVRQLSVIGLALAVTASVTVATGIVLPYLFGIFRFEEMGALSLVVLAVAMAYSILVRHLFDVRLVIRRAAVIAVMLAVAEQAYSESLTALVGRIPESASPAAKHVLSVGTIVVIAATFRPLKAWLEKELDRLLRSRRRRSSRR